MKSLTRKAFDRARTFLLAHARPLEQRLFAWSFEDGPVEAAMAELTRFQNTDGGFGHAMEPDIRTPDSSPIATTVGLQILRELATPADHPLVEGTIRYLLATYDARRAAWMIIPSTANQSPHAPWWAFDAYPPERWGDCLVNPRAEIVGYLHDYVGLVPGDLLASLTEHVVGHLNDLPDAMEMHDLLCYIRLAQTTSLPNAIRMQIYSKLNRAVDAVVATQPDGWKGYGLKPLAVAPSPDSPWADRLADAVALNLDYEIEHQQEDGSWVPNWSWGDAFADVWPDARREWQGILTLKTLQSLRSFGRIEGV